MTSGAEMDQALRSIGGATDLPRPKSLHIDAMFDRASSSTWRKYASGPSPAVRPPSPTSRLIGGLQAYPQPLPLQYPIEGGDPGPSPLAKLFEYSELVPLVLQWFDRPGELATLCRVSREFEYIARRRLYEHIWVRPWEKDPDAKFRILFHFFSRYPHLCKLVKDLDVRAFPLSARDSERYDIDDKAERSLAQMVSLVALTWTRDKSLTPPLVERISQLKHLRTLEISGHAERYYDPGLIGDMESLEELRIMMPDALWRDKLPGVARRLSERGKGGLRGLALVCRFSPLIDDDTLKALAPYLTRLRALTLWGTTRVTRRGVFAIMEQAEDVQELSLDASPHSDLLNLSNSPGMGQIRSFSLSIAAPHRDPLFLTTGDLPVLPSMPWLTSLSLSLSGNKAHMPRDGLPHLFAQLDFSRLTRLSLLSMVLATPQLASLLQTATQLQELFISINHKSTVLDCEELRSLAVGQLRVLHVIAPEKWRPDADDLAVLAQGLPLVEEIGSGNRVYEVVRREGQVVLLRWSRAYTPKYFQVWRG